MPLVIYGLLRAQTEAMTPATATAGYQLTFAPAAVARNALEYFDRAATLPLASAFVLTILGWPMPRLQRHHWRWITMGAVWMVGGYAVTLFLPVRSSLYVCLPAAGAALAGAAYLQTLWESCTARVRPLLLVVGVIAALVAVAALGSRNRSWVRPAELSTRTLDHLVRIADELPPDGGVLIHEDPAAPRGLDESFGTLLQTAAELSLGRPFLVWINPPPTDAELDQRAIADPARVQRHLWVRGGQIVETPP